MKTVYTNGELPHIWAKQTQLSGYGSNFFFEGKSIFSYGHHFEIARFVSSDTILFTNRRYGLATAKHIAYTRYAVNYLKTIYVHDFEKEKNIKNTEYEIIQLLRKASIAIKKKADYESQAMAE
jgi:hypothetical protein